MELRRRTLAKTLTYRTLGVVVTASVAWLLTGKVAMALGIGASDTLVKIAVYYLHERLWIRIPFGKPKPPEYNI
jgi:uncharacterized membrane protein